MLYYSFVQEHKCIFIATKKAREIDRGFNEGKRGRVSMMALVVYEFMSTNIGCPNVVLIRILL